MPNFIISTHRKDTHYSQPHLFILNKGLNSGKPQKEPFTNSFIVIFENENDCENYFFVAYSLWQTKFWHSFLYGSAIPFLRIDDFRREFDKKASVMMAEYEIHQKNITALKLLEQKEKYLNQNLLLIKNLRKVIIHNYCKR
jgi:hypothetical protein